MYPTIYFFDVIYSSKEPLQRRIECIHITQPQIVVEGGLYNVLLSQSDWLETYVKAAKEAAEKGNEILEVSKNCFVLLCT